VTNWRMLLNLSREFSLRVYPRGHLQRCCSDSESKDIGSFFVKTPDSFNAVLFNLFQASIKTSGRQRMFSSTCLFVARSNQCNCCKANTFLFNNTP